MGNAGLQPRKSESCGGGAGARASDDDCTYSIRPRPATVDIPKDTESPFFLFNSPTSSPMDSAIAKIPGAQNIPNSKKVEKKTVPHVFRWAHEGHQIFVTGTFNNWKERVPLRKTRDEFSAVINLPVGTHQFKYIVDNEWKYNPDLPTMPDRSGAVNNFLEIGNEDDGFDFEDFVSAPLSSSPPGTYGQVVPTLDNSTKPPPVLPPHLMQVLLNCEPVSSSDPSLLPIPNHVMLNHLYALSISDGVMVLAMTHRHEQKYVTTVLYRPVFDE